jgi:tRNA modification GTPase
MNPAARSVMAVLTPPGRGGIAVIRCAGPASRAALEAAFRPSRAGRGLPAPGALGYGHVVDAAGRPLDEVIIYADPCGAWEVNCHGGPAAVEAVCRTLAAGGIERVAPDALAAEEGASPIARAARCALARATTPLAARILLDQLAGALESEICRIVGLLEAARADEARAGVAALLEAWRTCGRFLARPPRIVIAGRPNAGKSTLLNRLAGAQRALTSAVPGTTRDYVEVEAALAGLPVVLVDTAGLREAVEAVEAEGVRRARDQAARAAVVVYLVDATEGFTPHDAAALDALGERALVVWNKADVAAGSPRGATSGIPATSGIRVPGLRTRHEQRVEPLPAPAISALTGAGVDALVEAILARLDYRAPARGAPVPFTAEQAAAIEALAAGAAR